MEILPAAVLSTKSMALVWTAAANGILPAFFLDRDIQSFRCVHSAVCFNMLRMAVSAGKLGFRRVSTPVCHTKRERKLMATHPPSATIISTMQTTGSNIASACIFVPMCPHGRP